jgi:hypothetical protein
MMTARLLRTSSIKRCRAVTTMMMHKGMSPCVLADEQR